MDRRYVLTLAGGALSGLAGCSGQAETDSPCKQETPAPDIYITKWLNESQNVTVTIREQREDGAVVVFEESYEVPAPPKPKGWTSVEDHNVYSQYLSRNNTSEGEYFATATWRDEVSEPVDATTHSPGTTLIEFDIDDEGLHGRDGHYDERAEKRKLRNECYWERANSST